MKGSRKTQLIESIMEVVRIVAGMAIAYGVALLILSKTNRFHHKPCCTVHHLRYLHVFHVCCQ